MYAELISELDEQYGYRWYINGKEIIEARDKWYIYVLNVLENEGWKLVAVRKELSFIIWKSQ